MPYCPDSASVPSSIPFRIFPIPPKSEIRNPLTFPQNIREKPYNKPATQHDATQLASSYTIYPIAAIVLLPILTKNLCRLFSGPAPCICDPAQDATPLIPYPLSPCGHQTASNRERLKLWRPCCSYLLRAPGAINRQNRISEPLLSYRRFPGGRYSEEQRREDRTA